MNELQRIQSKRKAFKAKYSGLPFNAYLNLALMALVFASSLLLSNANISWDLSALIIALVSLGYADGAYYFSHRFQQHRKIKFAEPVFEMHSYWHHGMFSENTMHVDSIQDINMVVLPFFVHGFVLGVIYLPIALFLCWAFGSDIGWVLLFSMTLYSIWYEIVHTVAHLENPPILKSLARHHTEHHDHRKMQHANFGIGSTLFDRLFKTVSAE